MNQQGQSAMTGALGPEARAREMFQSVLSGWVVDVLAMRRLGLSRPCLAGSGARRPIDPPGAGRLAGRTG